MFPPNTIIILFIALASLQLTSPFYILNYTSVSCDTSIDVFAANYFSDLEALLSALSTNLSTGFTNYTTGSVYGLALCRGDLPSSNCTDCISTAVASLRSECPFKKEAIVWREWCTVRYSNRYIFSTLEVEPHAIWQNVNGISGRSWTEVLDETLKNVTESAAGGGDAKKFATVYTSLRKMYAMAQCTPDLTEEECKECFRVAVGSLVVTRQGSIALLPSCIVRYELYPFFFNGTETNFQLPSPSPSPSLLPLPSLSSHPLPFSSPAEYRLHPYLRGKHNSKMILYSVCSGSVAFILLVLAIIICSQRGKIQASNFLSRDNFTRDNRNVENVLQSYASLTPKRCTYSDIKKMTRSFAEKLGEGGFGGVYKGKLLDGRLVAVKLLKGSKGNGEGFINEVASIGRTNHVNVVNLLGFCFEGNKRALVYEYIPNGSLEKFIHGEANNGHSTLPLETLFQVVLGVARGLEYLHRGCQTRILHFDIKPHNILLDEEFCPKISDFGLAKLIPQDKQSKVSMSGARGTVGYIAPEVFCRSFGDVSHKSDVYSYGMMVLEVIGSRKRANTHQVENSSEQYFPHWIYKQLEHEDEVEVDISMNDNDKDLKRKMVVVSLWCIQPVPSSRPSMSRVVQMLEGSLESIDVPPMPLHSSPPRIQWAPPTSSTMSPGVSPDSNH